MHVLFVHQNYPAQFGHIARYLVKNHGFRCTFVSQHSPGHGDGTERIQYHVKGGPTETTHYCGRSFESALWHSHAVYEALRARPDIQPDLVVGHSGYLSTAFLRELYACAIVNYFEFYYHTTGSDMDFRPEFTYPDLTRLRAVARNANLLLDLAGCDLGYSPTQWQQSLLPEIIHPKMRVVFDGIDTDLWYPRSGVPRRVGAWRAAPDMKIVTYVARGFESIRGFDIFMRMARLLCERRKDVVFVVVGEDRICYGGDRDFIGNRTFKEWVLAQDTYDLSRFIFTGRMPAPLLAELFAISDLHVYLTVPFILSWSLMDALACGATILASNTAPVREVIEHGRTGLLSDFFDVERMAQTASEILDHPQDFKHLGRQGVELIASRYSLAVCLPQLRQLYEDAVAVHKRAGRP